MVKRANTDVQNSKQGTKDWATLTPLKTEGELMCSGRVTSSCSASDTRQVIVTRHYPRGNHEWTIQSTLGTKQGTKSHKTKNSTEKTKTMNNTYPIKHGGEPE